MTLFLRASGPAALSSLPTHLRNSPFFSAEIIGSRNQASAADGLLAWIVFSGLCSVRESRISSRCLFDAEDAEVARSSQRRGGEESALRCLRLEMRRVLFGNLLQFFFSLPRSCRNVCCMATGGGGLLTRPLAPPSDSLTNLARRGYADCARLADSALGSGWSSREYFDVDSVTRSRGRCKCRDRCTTLVGKSRQHVSVAIRSSAWPRPLRETWRGYRTPAVRLP